MINRIEAQPEPPGLQPILDLIIAALREGRSFDSREVSIQFPGSAGDTLVVSVRPNRTPALAASKTCVRALDERQLGLVYGAIQDRIDERLSVSMLSSVAGLSRSHFSHAFRKSVGRTPHEHVVRTRIDRAMVLMRETAQPLGEIALATGFSDQAHFSNTFRRRTGATPSEWRAAHR